MKQAIRRQPIEISTKPPRKTSKIFRNTIFGCVVIVALWMIISLLTYHPDDPAWSKTIANSNINNWMGYRGAFFSDVLLTTIGQAAWFIPLLLIAYAYHLICQQGYKKLDIETVMIRIIGVILVLLTIASLFNIYNPNNDLVERGGAIGKFIGTLLTHSVGWMQALFPDSFVAITASKIILFFLLFITTMMASGCGPLAWIDAIGYGIIRSIHFMISFISKNNHNGEKNITDPESDLANIEHLMERVKNQPISKNKLKKDSLFSVLFKPKEKTAQSNLTELAQVEKTIQAPISPQKIEPKLSSIPPVSEPMTTNSNHKTVMLTPKFESQVDEHGEVKIPAIFKKPTIKSEPQNSKEERVQMLSDWVNESNTQQEIKAITTQTSESNSQVQQIVQSELHPPKERKNSFFSQVGSLFSSQPQTLAKPEPVIQSDDNDFNIFLQSLEKYHSPDQTIKALDNYDNDTPTVTFFNSDNANTQQDSDAVEFPTFEITDAPSLPLVNEITFEIPESKEEPSFATFNVEENVTMTHKDKPLPSWNFNDWENDEDIEDEAQEEILSFVKQLLVEQPLIKHPPIQPQTVEMMEGQISPKKAELLKHFPMAGQLPYLNLLGDPPPSINQYDVVELNDMAQLIEEQLRNFSIRVNVANIEPGPVVTRFELDLAPGVKVAQINNLEKDIARGLSVTSVRVVDIIPGTSYVGLEIPNKKRETVYFKSGLASAEYQAASHPLTLILGKSISGETVLANLAKMPHLLVAGTTGSGKSVGVNTMLLSMLFKASPEELRLILIDPKMLELSVYNDIPHLLTPVVTDMKESANALRWCVAEMERRYLLMSQLKVRNIAGFNQKVQDAIDDGQPIIDPLWRRREHVSDTENPPLLEKLPFIVVVIDEFADMMMLVGKKCEELIARLAQKARASGIHLILATQRPSVDVITGLIKANIPTRIAFQVSSKIDSRTIIDQQGADTLLGHGDMLYVPPGVSVPIRVHGAFVDDHEVNKVVEFLKLTGEPDYIEDILQEPTEAIPGLTPEASGVPASPSDEKDPLFDEAVKLVVESRRASISYIQRRLRVGYQRAARLMEEMEELRIVTPPQPNGNREVLMAAENNDDF